MTASRRPKTDEEIRAAVVGELKPLTAPIQLVDYDPSWPGLFAREEARIRGVLCERVVRLEHTGSTSVPGLAAKPIIDMTMIVRDVLDEDAYARDLEAAGYRIVIRDGRGRGGARSGTGRDGARDAVVRRCGGAPIPV